MIEIVATFFGSMIGAICGSVAFEYFKYTQMRKQQQSLERMLQGIFKPTERAQPKVEAQA